MISELIHTSLARGLDGTSGYTVAGRTGGMPVSMSDVLCRLSGLPSAWNEAAMEEKLMCAFRHIECGGQSFSVLSRIAPSGMDYTGRANRISHHRVVDARVMGESDPAALLEDDSLWRQEWVGAARELSSDNLPARLARDDAPLHTWQRVFGDAGWAASVLELIRKSGIGVWLVVPARSKKLRLCAEMMSLMPQEQRWDFTFATRPIALGNEASVKICFVDERELDLKAHAAGCAWILRVGVDALAAQPTGELAQRARVGHVVSHTPHMNTSKNPLDGKDVAWNAPSTLPPPHERQFGVAGASSAIGVADERQHAHPPEARIDVRRVAIPSTSSGVWKWFVATFIVVGTLVWLAIRSGANT